MDLIAIKNHGVTLTRQYETMLGEVQSRYPVISKATENFKKTQSQFMDNMLTVSHPTELRNARQILAEIEKAKMALDEAYFGIAKKKLDIKKKKLVVKHVEDLAAELLEIEIAELESQVANTMGYVEGAIRKIRAYMSQYDNILKSQGKTEFTEQDFEEDEERYHIMKMFQQALCAARSRGGVVDEGNQIYAYQIGINGTACQVEVRKYLETEGRIIENGDMPAHDLTVKWLNKMADKYKGSAIKYAELKGMTLIEHSALHITE